MSENLFAEKGIEMQRVNAVIQARMGSERLPGKTMLPIAGRPAIGLLIERLRYSGKIEDIVLATTVKAEDDVIEKFCRENGVICFRGESDDVLHRVYAAAKKYSTDVVAYVTGDCPLLDPWLIDKCIDIFLKSDYDYLSNFIEQSYPPGIDVQIFKFSVLDEVNRLANADKFREHVTLYILKHTEKYKLYNVKAPHHFYFPDWHLELDEPKDYELIKRIYENLYTKNPKFTTADIINLLKNNADWLNINKDVNRVWENIRKK